MNQQADFQLKPLIVNGQEVTAAAIPQNESASKFFACIATWEMFEQDPPAPEDIGEGGTPQTLFNQVAEMLQQQYLFGGADEKAMIFSKVEQYLASNPDEIISRMLSYAKDHPPELMFDEGMPEAAAGGSNTRKKVVEKAAEKKKKRAAQQSRCDGRHIVALDRRHILALSQ
jgi:hypothetical protein